MRLTHLAIVGVCAVLVVLAVLRRRQLGNSLRGFWGASASPVTLAVFRIVLFGTFLLSVNVPATVWYSRMPVELRIAPAGMGRILPHLPITPVLALMSALLLLLFCALAMIGLFTRVSAWLAVVLGLYVLGIPHFYGKVNHLHHHLIWFAALMATSPCADVLSFDAIARAWRRAGRGDTAPPAAARKYALPLRFVWLLMGVLYFFPGFWKLWHAGLSWASAENIKFLMFGKWIEFDRWAPALRIDRYPALCTSVGIGTLAFQISFVFLIFSSRLRPWLVAGGLAFHNVTNLFMRISFAPLQAMYVSLIDWARVFEWMGRCLFPTQLSVAYDGQCRSTRRMIASLRVFDVFGRVNYVENAGEAASFQADVGRRRLAAWLEQRDGEKAGQSLTGSAACRALSARLPILWPVLPLLYVVPQATDRFSHRLASLCNDEVTPQWRREFQERAGAIGSARSNGRVSATMIVGTVLLLANVTFGVRRMAEAWPFACYPAFDFRASSEIHALTLAVQPESGQTRELSRAGLNPNMPSDRARGLQEAVMAMKDPEARRVRLRALWQLWERNHPELRNPRTVWFYRDTLTTVPEQRARNPLRREILLALPWPDAQR